MNNSCVALSSLIQVQSYVFRSSYHKSTKDTPLFIFLTTDHNPTYETATHAQQKNRQIHSTSI